MKYLFLISFFVILLGCQKQKSVYWCGDHACINKKEKEVYFRKTMIVEKRQIKGKKNKHITALEKIKKQSGLIVSSEEKDTDNKNNITTENKIDKKELAKKIRLEEKRQIKEEKELAKQLHLEEKRRIKQEKKLVKQKNNEKTSKKDAIADSKIDVTNLPAGKFEDLVKKIITKNESRPYPDINNIPN